MLAPFRGRGELPRVESTRPELELEKMRRRIEHNRTERLAQTLDDYRAQDRILRR
jgi:hypothetical protein